MDTTSIDPFSPPPSAAPTAPGFRGRTASKAPAVRAGMALGAALLVVIGTAVTLGASPSAGGSGAGGHAAGSGSATPQTTGSDAPEKAPGDRHGGGPDGFGPGIRAFGGLVPGFLGPGKGGRGFGQITISAISGSALSLRTDDGWTRTITITPDTTITRGGGAATATDLKVGDAIRFRQTKNADGSFTIRAIDVVLPRTAGTIESIGTSSITMTDRDGAAVTVHVGAGTTFRVRGVDNATAASLAKGMVVLVVGERRGDGSIDATAVVAGKLRDHAEGPKPPGGSSAKPEASDAAG